MTSIELLNRLTREISQCIETEVSSEDRASLSAALTDISLEHYRSISILVGSKLFGSAAALVRLQIESFVVGLWIFTAATDEEIYRFKSNKPLQSRGRRKVKNKKVGKQFGEYVEELKDKIGDDLSKEIIWNKADLWKALNGYTHGGNIAVTRRFKGNSILCNYDEGTLEEMAQLSNQYAVFALNLIGNLSVNDNVWDDINRLIGLHLEVVATTT